MNFFQCSQIIYHTYENKKIISLCFIQNENISLNIYFKFLLSKMRGALELSQFFSKNYIICPACNCREGNTQNLMLNGFFLLSFSVQKRLIEKDVKGNCNENQLILQLARLYATSPERIISLLCTDSVNRTCLEVSDVLERINHTLSDCKPLQKDNLYLKLNNGLDYLNSYLCRSNANSKSKRECKFTVCSRISNITLLPLFCCS